MEPMSLAELATVGITPEYFAMAFAFGFGSITTSWFLGFVIDLAVQSIRKA